MITGTKIKNRLIKTILLVGMLSSGPAFANFLDCDAKFYLGAEIQGYRNNGIKSLTKEQDGFVVTVETTDNSSLFGRGGAGLTGFLGVRLNPCLGLELGYTTMTTHQGTNTGPLYDANLTTKVNNFYFDVLGHYCLTECLEGIGSVGVGLLSTSASGSVTSRSGISNGRTFNLSQRKTEAGIRLGLGLAYMFNQNIGTRLMFRYQQGNKHVNNISSLALGLLYQF